MSERHNIGGDGLSAAISADGAELISLSGPDGTEMLWQAGPEWPRHAPVLFPIVGRLADDTLRHAGQDYRLTQHGFARDRRFAFTERGPSSAVLRLEADAATRAVYPFDFVLELLYAIDGTTLSVTARVSNPGSTILPFCIGAHPAFCWPLAAQAAKSDHHIVFESVETGPLRSVEGGLLGAARPLPFDGRTLPLSDALFAGDALVMPDVASRSVRYAALDADGAETRAMTVSWEGYGDLGLWSKPSGAPFVCIEPWQGMASPVGWDGDILDKPGVTRLDPGGSRDFTWRVTL